MLENSDLIKSVLLNHGVIAFVTDTVWGIGCLPESKIAVEKIYNLKERDKKKPLILMSSEVYNLFPYVQRDIPKDAQKLIKENFPGAFTLVLPKSEMTPDFITSNMSTVGIRVPACPVFAEICELLPRKVLATTSANLSEQPPALTYEQAVEFIGDKVDLVVKDYGFQASGKPSSVVGVIEGKITVFRK